MRLLVRYRMKCFQGHLRSAEGKVICDVRGGCLSIHKSYFGTLWLQYATDTTSGMKYEQLKSATARSSSGVNIWEVGDQHIHGPHPEEVLSGSL
jgi:hypothetical protein